MLSYALLYRERNSAFNIWIKNAEHPLIGCTAAEGHMACVAFRIRVACRHATSNSAKSAITFTPFKMKRMFSLVGHRSLMDTETRIEWLISTVFNNS